jgi:hypothetical protein
VLGKLIILLLLLVPEMAGAQIFGSAATRARANRMLNAIEAADANRDKITTRAEFKVAREMLARKALNGDQSVNLAALESDASARTRQKSKMDTNRDGKISITEFANFLPRVWQDADDNNDNRISAAELKAARSALQ